MRCSHGRCCYTAHGYACGGLWGGGWQGRCPSQLSFKVLTSLIIFPLNIVGAMVVIAEVLLLSFIFIYNFILLNLITVENPDESESCRTTLFVFWAQYIESAMYKNINLDHGSKGLVFNGFYKEFTAIRVAQETLHKVCETALLFTILLETTMSKACTDGGSECCCCLAFVLAIVVVAVAVVAAVCSCSCSSSGTVLLLLLLLLFVVTAAAAASQ